VQRVRFRRLTISLGLALLLSLLLMSGGISAQDANQAVADLTWASPSGNTTITVTVNDSDINKSGAQDDIGPDKFGNVFSIDGFAALGTSLQLFVANFPIADRNGDGSVNALDVTIYNPGTDTTVDTGGNGDADLAVQSVDGDNGIIEIRVVDNVVADAPFRLVYNSAVINVSTDADGGEPAVISSNENITGFGLRLDETGKNTGLYSATVEIATSASQTDFAAFDETGVGVDLNGDGDALDTAVGVGLYEAAYGGADLDPAEGITVVTTGTVDETVTGTDVNGDGDALDVAVSATYFYEAHYGVDLNGDGDTEDAVTQYAANLFPNGTVRPSIQVSSTANDVITITYTDLDGDLERTAIQSTDSVTVESTDPAFSGLSPASGSATTDVTPDIVADVTDSDSGVTEASIAIEVHVWADDGDGKVQEGEVGAPIAGSPFTPTTSAITGGFRATTTLPQQIGDPDLAWRTVATDVAGNAGASDSDASDTGADISYQALSVDNTPPSLLEAFAGHALDADGALDVAANSATTVRARFDESLDADSVVPSDFTVGGVTPTAANVSSGNVYLTVSSLAPSATPEVELVGKVSDRAGNELGAGSKKTASDVIAPTISVTLGASLTNDTVKVSITSDEDIIGSPTLRINGNAALGGLTNPGARLWERTVTKAEADGVDGRVTVYAEGRDASGNVGSKGSLTDGGATGAVTYELDLAINDNGAEPIYVVSGDDAVGAPETSEVNPFVRIQFNGEGTEYEDDAAADVDTHALVTITTLTLTKDGETAVDILGTEVRRTDSEFVLALTGLSVGSTYTITLNAEDEIGNVYALDQAMSLDVVARAKVALALQPGMNLVSFPEAPVEPGINEVFPASSNVDVVLAYDPSQDVPWLVSQRNTGTGLFGSEAEIQTIQIGLGYWVQSTGFNDISYSSRPFIQSGVVPPPVPPAIPVVGGQSNLVGFVSLTGAANALTDTYFQGVTWQVAYSFAPDSGWTASRPGDASTVVEGKGYILFAAANGWVTP